MQFIRTISTPAGESVHAVGVQRAQPWSFLSESPISEFDANHIFQGRGRIWCKQLHLKFG